MECLNKLIKCSGLIKGLATRIVLVRTWISWNWYLKRIFMFVLLALYIKRIFICFVINKLYLWIFWLLIVVPSSKWDTKDPINCYYGGQDNRKSKIAIIEHHLFYIILDVPYEEFLEVILDLERQVNNTIDASNGVKKKVKDLQNSVKSGTLLHL